MKRQLYMLFFITLICTLLLGGTANAWAAEATLTTSLVVLNGNTLPCAAYNIGGNNYFKLRDIMQALDKSVTYDAASATIYIETARDYTPDGSELAKPAATSATANPATVNVILNGAAVNWTAYNIGGSNYFRLRDITQALDVFTYYCEQFNAIYLDTSKSYVAEAPAATAPLPPAAVISGNGSGALSSSPIITKLVDGKDLAREDFSQQANPAIFDSVFTRGAYNTIRQSIIDRDIIIPGNNYNGFNPNYHYAHAVLPETDEAYTALNNVLSSIGMYYWYVRKAEPYTQEYYKYPSYFICAPTSSGVFAEANAATEDIINQAKALQTDAEKVKLLNNYQCEAMVYDVNASAPVTKIFTSSAPVAAACSSYANAFQYLCDRAGIPCVTISGENHMWNMVYADGKWLYVDVSQNDLTSSPATLLSATCNKTDGTPKVTAFCKELLVPGSTR